MSNPTPEQQVQAEPQQQPQPQQYQPQPPIEQPSQPKKKSRKALGIGGTIALVIVLIIVGHAMQIIHKDVVKGSSASSATQTTTASASDYIGTWSCSDITTSDGTLSQTTTLESDGTAISVISSADITFASSYTWSLGNDGLTFKSAMDDGTVEDRYTLSSDKSKLEMSILKDTDKFYKDSSYTFTKSSAPNLVKTAKGLIGQWSSGNYGIVFSDDGSWKSGDSSGAWVLYATGSTYTIATLNGANADDVRATFSLSTDGKTLTNDSTGTAYKKS